MRILMATDGAPHTDAALCLGGQIADALDIPVTLLTIIGSEGERVQAASILIRAQALVPDTVESETKIRFGQRARQIMLEVAALREEGEEVLLLLGERGQRGLARRLLAPTVERILQRMPCPVVIARGPVRLPQRLLVCESGRDPSLLHRLLAQCRPLLRAADSLTVLHVMSQMAAGPGVAGWQLRAGAEALMGAGTPEGELLEEDLAQLKQLPAHLEARVRHGLVVKEILDEARSGDYDLVVIGAHQAKQWERFLLDDLAQEIVDHADRSVLVV